MQPYSITLPSTHFLTPTLSPHLPYPSPRDAFHNDLEDGGWFGDLTVSLVAPTAPYTVALNAADDVLSQGGVASVDMTSGLVNYNNG